MCICMCMYWIYKSLYTCVCVGMHLVLRCVKQSILLCMRASVSKSHQHTSSCRCLCISVWISDGLNISKCLTFDESSMLSHFDSMLVRERASAKRLIGMNLPRLTWLPVFVALAVNSLTWRPGARSSPITLKHRDSDDESNRDADHQTLVLSAVTAC